MKKLLVLLMALVMVLGVTACSKSDTPKEAKYVSMTFGDITMSVPDVFNAVKEQDGGLYVSAGPNASIVVTSAFEIDLLPSDWDESVAKDILEPMYGATYTNLELSAFEGDVNMNGNTAVYYSFKGTHADSKDRLVQVVRLYNDDLTEQYEITFMQAAEDKFFTAEVGGKIINSSTLNK